VCSSSAERATSARGQAAVPRARHRADPAEPRTQRRRHIPGARTVRADVTDPAGMRAGGRGSTGTRSLTGIAFSEEDVERDIESCSRSHRAVRLHQHCAALPQGPRRGGHYGRPRRSRTRTGSTPARRSRAKNGSNAAHRDEGFPATIVRPSHTYDTVIPVPIGGWNRVHDRRSAQDRKEDHHSRPGTSLWTMTHAKTSRRGSSGCSGSSRRSARSSTSPPTKVLTWNQIYGASPTRRATWRTPPHPDRRISRRASRRWRGRSRGQGPRHGCSTNSKIKRFVPQFASDHPFP